MIDAELLKILCCPENHQPLEVAGAPLIAQINERIAAGQLKNREGKPITQPIDSGLVRADGAVLYPIRDEIPVLLMEEGIPLPLS